MKEKIRQFMIGRYGTDGLNQFLNIASLVLILVYILTRLPLLLYVVFQHGREWVKARVMGSPGGKSGPAAAAAHR